MNALTQPVDWAFHRMPGLVPGTVNYDGRPCPLRDTTAEAPSMLFGGEIPHGLAWLAYRGLTVRLVGR